MTKRYMDFAPKKASKKTSGPQVIVSTTAPRVVKAAPKANAVRVSRPARPAGAAPKTASVRPGATGAGVSRVGAAGVGAPRSGAVKASAPRANAARPAAAARPTRVSVSGAAATRPVAARPATTRPMAARTGSAQTPVRMISNTPPMNNGSRNKSGVRLGEIEDVQFSEAGLLESPLEAEMMMEEPRKVPRKVKTTDTYAVPRTPFINQDKVAKRPLSKNVYRKQAAASKAVKNTEKAPAKKKSKPVTIIAKPEKDSRVGMVVAIVLTIILGAVAGTVAFLLLPK